MKLALLLFLTLTTFCLSSVDKRSKPKSKTSKMKSFFGKEENEEGLILVDDMWLDRDDLDWEEEGGREGRHGVKSKRRLWPRKKVKVTEVRGVLYYKISREFSRDQRMKIRGAIEALEKKLEQCVIFRQLDVKSKRKDFVHVKLSKKNVVLKLAIKVENKLSGWLQGASKKGAQFCMNSCMLSVRTTLICVVTGTNMSKST